MGRKYRAFSSKLSLGNSDIVSKAKTIGDSTTIFGSKLKFISAGISAGPTRDQGQGPEGED